MSAPFMSTQTSKTIGFDYCLAQLKPASPYGQTLKKALTPFLPGEEAALNQELNSVGELLALLNNPKSGQALDKMHHFLAQIPDWREALHRVSSGMVLNDPELFALKQNVYFIQQILRIALPLEGLLTDELPEKTLKQLAALLDPEKSGSPAFYLADQYSPELARVRATLRELQRNLLQERKKQTERLTAEFGLSFNPAGEIAIPRINAHLRDQIENSNYFHLSRETYTDLYYQPKETPQESALLERIEREKVLEKDEEEEVRAFLSSEVRQRSEDLYIAFKRIARFDLTLAKALLAKDWNCSRPLILSPEESLQFEFVKARHPLVQNELKEEEEERFFTPLDMTLNQGLAVITGANMGGKTVTLRTIGLMAALVAYGFYVPAKELKITLFNHIRILAGDYTVELTGLSRFGQEIVSLRGMLPLRSERALLLLDELAASTNPTEGRALAVAVAEYLGDDNCITVLATHYDLFERLSAADHWQVVGLSQAKADELKLALDLKDSSLTLADLMDYSLQPVSKDLPTPREAIRVAKHLKLPHEIIVRAMDLTQTRRGGDNNEQN